MIIIIKVIFFINFNKTGGNQIEQINTYTSTNIWIVITDQWIVNYKKITKK